MTLEFAATQIFACGCFFIWGHALGRLKRIHGLETLQADLVYSLYHQIYQLEVKVASYERATTPPDPQGPVYEIGTFQQSNSQDPFTS